MIIVELLYNLAALVALSVLSGFINLRYDRSLLLNKILQGILFGTAAIIGMLNPFIFSEGIIFDGRSIVISLCALFFGPVAGIISALMAVVFRVSIGGNGLMMGTLVILSSLIIGLFFYFKKQQVAENRITNLQLFWFGILVHIAMLILVLTLPTENILNAYKTVTFTVLVVYPLVTVVIGKILFDQEENKRFITKLKESEENYRLLVENQTDLVVKIDKNGILIFVSPSYCKLFGKSKSELLGKSFMPLVHKDDIEMTQKEMLKLYREPYTCYVEQRALTVEGWRWIAWSDSAILDSKGNVESIIGVGRDITSIKTAQEGLLNSEEKFYKAFQASPDSLSLTELETGRIIDANDGFLTVFGYSPDEVIGKSTLDLNVWTDPEDRVKIISKLKAEGRARDFEAVGRRKNGEMLIGLLSAEIIKVAGEQIILMIVKDITLSKKSEESLKKNEEKYRMLVELASDAFFQGDANGNLITINDKSIELTGYTKDDLLKMNIKDLFADDTLEEVPFRYDLLKGGDTFKTERSLLKKDGEKIVVEMNSRQMPDGTYQSFFRDITERKKLFNHLIEAKEKAEEMNRIKTFFFANMSHELRTPFVGIQGYSELLADSLKDPEAKDMAEQILKASKRLTDTLNKILNVTRLEFDKLELNLTKVDVVELIETLSKLFEKSAEINHTTLNVNILFKPIVINSDAKLLGEILTNLINNAVKYTHNGTIDIICNLEIIDQVNILKINISDTGVGIPIEKQEVIWQEFRQASEGFNRSFEGTGLGLTIIKKYVTALNGKISLSSEVEKGTTFTIELPVTFSKISDDTEKSTIEINQTPATISESSTANVLYVEDDMIALKYIEKILNPLYKITTAFTADLALELVNKFTYDILMLDINLGRGIDGIELMKTIRKIPAYTNIPIVAVTAYAAESDKQEFLAKGFSHYISKPFSSAQLKNLLQGLVKQINK